MVHWMKNTFCAFGIDTEQKRSLFYKIQSFSQHKLNKKKACRINILQTFCINGRDDRTWQCKPCQFFLYKFCWKFKEQKIAATKIHSKKLTITTRNRVVAKQSRCEGVYNWTGDPSVIFAEKEALYSEWETAKGCCEQYGANDDVVGRWLAAAEKINGYMRLSAAIKSNSISCRRDSPCGCPLPWFYM